MRHYAESKPLVRHWLPVAQRELGPQEGLTLEMTTIFAITFYNDPQSSRADLLEAESLLQDSLPMALRTFGRAHPSARIIIQRLEDLRRKINKLDEGALSYGRDLFVKFLAFFGPMHKHTVTAAANIVPALVLVSTRVSGADKRRLVDDAKKIALAQVRAARGVDDATGKKFARKYAWALSNDAPPVDAASVDALHRVMREELEQIKTGIARCDAGLSPY
mmetsp:Transcript_15475/g.46408  ORF Transcript_15475/g.46408 Transcript_15475/m.46408 type:complete len:220 (+) Transcript_15475:448-1107(+)